jgi:hypothetical protein
MADFSSKEYTLPQRWQLFQFYGFGGAVDSYVSHQVTHSGIWKLEEVRLNCSAACGSNKYFQMYLSSGKGSYYDIMMYSYNMIGSTEILVRYSNPLIFLSDDTLEIMTSQISVAFTYGLTAIGWAVTG